MGEQKHPSPPDPAPSKSDPYVTRFASQKLMGYQCDATGNFIVKVFKGEVSMSDGSSRVIYGMKSCEGFDDVQWDWQNKNPPPIIHRDNFGIWVVDPKTILK